MRYDEGMRWVAVMLLLVLLSAASGQVVELPSIHQIELQAHPSEVGPVTLLAPAATTIMPLQPRAAMTFTPPTKAIFGYLPYWERAAGEANIRWNLLTHLACFSMGVNTNGSLQAMSGGGGWPGNWTSLINTAHANGVKVILVVTLFNQGSDEPDYINQLITNPTATTSFINNVKAQLVAGSCDGLNVDFEGTPTGWRTSINSFMATVTNSLHAENPDWEISFAGPALKSNWDLPGLAASCDYIFIMGYAFYGSWSATSGPCAPLDPKPPATICIRNTVESQYNTVTHNTPEKLILGLPSYGGHWKTQTSDAYSTKVAWVGSTRFRDDMTTSLDYGLLWDTHSQTPWYRWYDDEYDNWHQVWFDNDVSLGLKFQLAQDHDYRGVGMWALNYDGARPELWNELARRFSPDWVATPPDFDGDGDVDQTDFGTFQRCVTGPGVPQWNHACSPARLDRDLDVDADDAARFINCMEAPGDAPASGCAG